MKENADSRKHYSINQTQDQAKIATGLTVATGGLATAIGIFAHLAGNAARGAAFRAQYGIM